MDPFMFQHHAMQASSAYDHHRTIAPTSKQRPEGPENENRGRKLKEVATHKISAKVFEMSGMNHDFPIYQTAIDHVSRAFAGKPYMDQWPVQQAGKATKAERRESQGAVLEIAGIMRQFAETLTTHLDVVSTLLVKLHGALAMVTARFYRKHKANDAVMVKSIFVDVTFNTFIVNTWRIDLTVLRTRFASFDWANNFDAYRLSKDCREWENPLSLVVNHVELQSLQDRISSVTMQNEHLAKENTQLKQEVQALRNQLQQARGTTPPCGLQSYHFVPQSNGGSSHGGSSQPGTPQGDAKRPMFDFQSITPTYKTDTSVSAPNSLLAWQPNMNEATFNVNGFPSRGTHIPAGSGSDTSDPHSLFSQTGFSQSRGGLPATQIVLGNNGHALGHVGASSSAHGSVSAPMVRSLTPSSGSVSAPNTPPHSNPMVATQYIMQQQHQPPQQERHFAGPARMIGNVALDNRTRSSSELATTTFAPSLGSRPVPILAGGGIFDAPMTTASPYSHSSASHASMDMSQQLLLAQANLEQQQQQMLQSQRQPHVDMSGWPQQTYAYDSNPLPPHIAYGEDVDME